jgi:hypothetical protein
MLTGDPIGGAQALAEKTVDRKELEGLPDQELLNRLARKTCIATLLVHDELVKRLPTLLPEKIRETAALIKALADCHRAITAALVHESNIREHPTQGR